MKSRLLAACIILCICLTALVVAQTGGRVTVPSAEAFDALVARVAVLERAVAGPLPPPPTATPEPTPAPSTESLPTADQGAAPAPAPAPVPVPGAHGYFLSLSSRPDVWKTYSLRSQAQLNTYKNANSLPPAVNYLWPNDRYDAARVVIPMVGDTIRGNLATDVASTATQFTVPYWSGEFLVGRLIRVDDEYVTITGANSTTKTLTVARGAVGSTAAPHLQGAPLRVTINSLPNQVRLPFGGESGHAYLVTWDALWTESYLASGLTNHKAFQFSNGNDGLWLENQVRYSGDYASGFNPLTDVASLTMRSYNAIGGNADYTLNDPAKAFVAPGVTKVDPLLPMANSFIVKPNRWVRFWVRLDLRATDYDVIDLWAADETRDPVQVYRGMRVTGWGVKNFWLEFNTSTDRYVRGAPRDLVAYVRNVVMLRDLAIGDLSPLLERPSR